VRRIKLRVLRVDLVNNFLVVLFGALVSIGKVICKDW
jgi:hypothetical protein